MADSTKQSFLKGAAILAVTNMIVKLIAALYKLPVLNILGDDGSGHFQIAYNLYVLLLTISSAGIPVALSRLISAASTTGRPKLVKMYFSASIPFFALFGLILALLMIVFADPLAALMGDAKSGLGIRVLAPAVLFSCIISIYKGYFQGHSYMIPTAVSQLMEAVCKLLIGLFIAWLLLGWGYETSFVTAGSFLGITVGLCLAIPVLIVFKHRFDKQHYLPRRSETDRQAEPKTSVLLDIFRVSIPITLGSAILNIMTLIDTRVVMSRLETGAGFSHDNAISLYGVYAKGLSIFNIPAALVSSIAISIVPVIAATIALKRRRDSVNIMESSLKLANLIAMPAGVGLSILAEPIFKVLYWGSNPVAPTLLSTLGIASYFMCMQLVTVGILQATGHEKVPLLTCTIGGLLQIALDFYLTGQPHINIMGSPFGTLTCYGTITILNLIFINYRVKERPELAKVFIKPALCTAAMGLGAWAVYELLFKLGAGSNGSGPLGVSHSAYILYLLGAIVVAVVVYGILIIATKTVTRDDMKLIPKGERLANFLKIK